MEVNIYGRNIKISDRLREYVEEKVEKFEQLGDNVSDIDVKVTKDGHLGGESIRVEITVVGRGPVLRAEAQGHDKFAVFDVSILFLSQMLQVRFLRLPRRLRKFCYPMFLLKKQPSTIARLPSSMKQLHQLRFVTRVL